MKEFFNSYGMGIISAIFTAVIGFIGTKIKAYLDNKENAEFTEKSVEKVVKAIEQMYQNLKGEEKFQMAIDDLTEMLEHKGIYVTDLELEILIESAVAELNKPWKKGDSE